MLPLKIAVSTSCFQQPIKTALQTAAQLNARAVQLDSINELSPLNLTASGVRHFLHHLGEVSLKVASLRFPARKTFYDQQDLETRMQALRTSMKLAWELKAKVVTVRLGQLPTDENSPEWQLLFDVVNDLAATANLTGVTLAVTPTTDSPARLEQFLQSILTGPVGINFDPATFIIAGHDPIEAFKQLYRSVVHVQIRDAVRDLDGTGIEVPIGRGDVNWDELLALLDQSDYAGWLTIERNTGSDILGDMARAVQYLQRVIID